MHRISLVGLVAFFASCSAISVLGADKPKITSQDRLPRYSYPFTGKVTDVITVDSTYDPLALAVRSDLEKLLADFDIADRATLQGVLSTLMTLDVQTGHYDSALKRIDAIRALEEKPAAKLTTALVNESYILARKKGDFTSDAAFRAEFAKIYAEKLAVLPYDVVADNLKQAKAGAEIASRSLVLGNLDSSFQTGVDKSGAISGDVARVLLTQRTGVELFLPLRSERIAALTAFIGSHQKPKVDIWAAREVSLDAESKLTPVTIAVWDSGVDMPVFPKQQWTNAAEIPGNGVDDDNNGFIDDVHGIAFDLQAMPTPGLLVKLDEGQRAAYPAMRNRTKGILDLQANIDSPEAAELKQHMSTLQPADVKGFIENLNFFGNFTHGTHVAGIASAHNPAARLLAIRITFDYRMIPDLPTREQAERDAAAARSQVAYLEKQGVRVVNMSWGGSPKSIEEAFEANGAGGTPDERRKTAREYFELFRVAMTEAMRSAPEILFVAAAGNSDNDAGFAEFVPSGIDLPNVLTVGAVDQAGEETSFSSFGKNVDVHANGFEVESALPGGERMKYSGTSMAAPNVANLAGKLLAVEPKLNVERTIGLIKLGADRSADGRIDAINPKRSFALLKAMKLN